MKKFLKISSVLIRVSCLLIILCFSVGFLIRSIHPAFAGGNSIDMKSAAEPLNKKILWVNVDSVNAKYKAFTDLAEKFGKALKKKEEDYKGKTAAIQQRYDLLQQRLNAGLISPSQYKYEEFSITTAMGDLQVMEAEILEMEAVAMERNAAITKDVTLFLEKLAVGKKADYILSYGGASTTLYANPVFEITEEVITGLNAEYDKKGK